MNDEIKEINECIEYLRDWCCEEGENITITIDFIMNVETILDYITNLQQENERLKEQNNDLRKIYKHTYNRLFENGNDELARYFQAQIDDCPTFYVEPIIDYHKEWKDYKSRIEKAVEYIKKHIEKCNIDGYEGKFDNFDIFTKPQELLNILNGRSDE